VVDGKSGEREFGREWDGDVDGERERGGADGGYL
jgi:hypothetical protein